jgi:hypothetical protein
MHDGIRTSLGESPFIATNTSPINTQSILRDALLVTASKHDRGAADMSFRERCRLSSDHSRDFSLSPLAARHEAPHPKRHHLLRLEIKGSYPYRPCSPLIP